MNFWFSFEISVDPISLRLTIWDFGKTRSLMRFTSNLNADKYDERQTYFSYHLLKKKKVLLIQVLLLLTITLRSVWYAVQYRRKDLSSLPAEGPPVRAGRSNLS